MSCVPPALPPRNLAQVGMYLGAIRLRLMAAKDRKNPAFKAHILRDGGWVRKPAIATMTTDDIIEKTQAVGPILACIHTPATTHIGTGLSRKDCAAGENQITRDKFFRKDGDRARSLLGHAWRRVYKYKLDKKGRVVRDEDGLALLKCHRGTNDVEATHRVINKMLGTSSCGEEFAERLGRWASASLQP